MTGTDDAVIYVLVWVEGLEFNETFTMTCFYEQKRLSLALREKDDLALHPIDVKSSFFNSPPKATMYTEQPEDFNSQFGPPQTGRDWYKTLNNFIHDCSVLATTKSHWAAADRKRLVQDAEQLHTR